MPKRQLMLALDVGTTKVSALVAEAKTDGELAVLGIAATPVVGMRRGLVFEVERVALAIRDAANRANSMAGTELTQAAVAINGEHLALTPGQGKIALKTGVIREEDLQHVMAKASHVSLGNDREVIRVIRRGIAVDGFRGVVDPVGMVAHTMEADVFVVSGLNTVIRNLRHVVNMAGLNVLSFVPAPEASANAVLSDDEKQVGVVHLDVGGGTTGVSVYRGGHLQYLGVVPLGGESITSDLSVGLGVVATQAERLKLEHAAVGSEREGTLEVRAVSGQAVKLIPIKELQEIVAARIDEWTDYVEKQLQKIEWTKGPAAGVVMTGGGALLKGLDSHLATRWGWPVRIGGPYGLGGLSDLSKSPGYATVVGVAKAMMRDGVAPEPETLWRRLIQFWVNLWG
ncbi:cell division protein FtsA [Sulfobacillus thermosulfidooxidans]|uniref:Cell division protein FtsA n=1 Tax=Sulfobacillus thermosulfidooxidans TaxID=28034 RepID=A0A1R0IQ73_SULTH|nr:cell division protein FtsA [Sulfobacillus thermosulfidooxidans]OLZ09798.1 cell division protein FtsA [Sulfobacillus thermosulfidooxidans]OLZ15896.1 cell division protein FtsA [Sulfobacillus thermosulfidooxidans]OLZ18257.1 cell division protein FtsA [Sulfobacillus thermosulfidooxidans]PSR30008.1 MAG: cell division protein FtsA [Sulfobacillus thermosulfidooxidans]